MKTHLLYFLLFSLIVIIMHLFYRQLYSEARRNGCTAERIEMAEEIFKEFPKNEALLHHFMNERQHRIKVHLSKTSVLYALFLMSLLITALVMIFSLPNKEEKNFCATEYKTALK